MHHRVYTEGKIIVYKIMNRKYSSCTTFLYSSQEQIREIILFVYYDKMINNKYLIVYQILWLNAVGTVNQGLATFLSNAAMFFPTCPASPYQNKHY